MTIITIIIFFVLLFFSAFFSGSELALFSLKTLTLKKYKTSKTKLETIIYNLLRTPNKLLVTILSGNTLVNITLGSLATVVVLEICNKLGISEANSISIATFGMTFIILIFGEITPKIISVNYYKLISKLVAIPIFVLTKLFSPFVGILTKLTDIIIGASVHQEKATAYDLTAVVKAGYKEGVIDFKEKEMIGTLVTGGIKEVGEIMIPRAKIFAVSRQDSIENIITTIAKGKYSRVPIFRNKSDIIEGVIYKKELLPYYLKYKKLKSLKKIIHPVLYFPETKKITELLAEFQKTRTNFGVVVDSYGMTIGIVTLDDIVKAIIPHKQLQPAFYKKIEKNKYVVDAEVRLDEFNRVFHTSFDAPASETLAGYIIKTMQKIPQENEIFTEEHINIKVHKVKDQKIEKVIVEII